MRFVNPIIFVKDIGIATAFYRDVLGLTVKVDHGTIVIFEERFAIHDATALIKTVWGATAPPKPEPLGQPNLLLYFEDEDIDACFARLSGKVELIHPVTTQAWGQRVFRFYDPDRHAVEIGEPLAEDEDL